MRGKLVLLAGVGIGYVLGARAGRERYEDIKRWAGKVWTSPGVQEQVHQATEFAKDKAPDVVGLVADGVSKVISRSGRGSRRPNSKKRSSGAAESDSAGSGVASPGAAMSDAGQPPTGDEPSAGASSVGAPKNALP